MNRKKKKKYEKPHLTGEPFFEALALACCKDTKGCTAQTGRSRNQCTRPLT